MTPEQLADAGRAARALYSYVLGAGVENPYGVRVAIKAVCRTANSAPVESVALLNELITPTYLASHGAENLRHLADGVPFLVEAAPSWLVELYGAAFGYEETSRDSTALGRSTILPLSSNRQQDYDGALMVLAERFEGFLNTSPDYAIAALCAVAVATASNRWLTAHEPEVHYFNLRGRPVEVHNDGSHMWDTADWGHENLIPMLTAFDKFLDQMAAPEDLAKRQHFLDLLAGLSGSAVIWRHLVDAGARYPQTWGVDIAELAEDPFFLTDWDVTSKIGPFLVNVYPFLDADRRQHIERQLLRLPDWQPDVSERMAAIRRRLLSGVEEPLLVTPEAIELVQRLRDTPRIPEPSDSDELDDAADLLGADFFTAGEAAPSMEAAEATLSADAPSVFPNFELRVSRLKDEDPDGRARRREWGVLAREVETWLGQLDPATDTEVDEAEVVLASIAEMASRLPEPDELNEAPLVWDDSNVGVTAALGLSRVAMHRQLSPPARDALIALARAPSIKTRSVVANNLTAVAGRDPDLAWSIAEEIVKVDRSGTVVRGLLEPARMLMYLDAERGATLIEKVWGRVPREAQTKEIRERAAGLLAELWVERASPSADRYLRLRIAEPRLSSVELGGIPRHLRNAVTKGFPGTAEDRLTRERAIRLLCEIVSASTGVMREVETSLSGHAGPWPEEQSREWVTQANVLNGLSGEVMFGSKAYDVATEKARDEHDLQKLKRFYSEAQDLFDGLAQVGWAPVTHHLIETLHPLVRSDPLGVLRIAHRAIVGDRRYQVETLGLGETVKFCELYLSDHREAVLASPDAARMLAEILQAFEDAGWPEAHQLTHRLEAIYR